MIVELVFWFFGDCVAGTEKVCGGCVCCTFLVFPMIG